MAAGQKRKRKRIRDLHVAEASLVDHPANRGARVLLYKRGPEMETITKSEISEMLAEHLAGIEPDLSTRAALLKRWSDPSVQHFLAMEREAEPDPAPEPVTKARSAIADEMDQLTAELMAEKPGLSRAAARALVWDARPDLVDRQRREAEGRRPREVELKAQSPAEMEIERLADEIRTRAREAGKPVPTKAAARAQAWQMRPDLARQARQEAGRQR